MEDVERNKGGRPRFKPTKAMRQDVMLWVACGMGEEAISGSLGIARGTLREHFAAELANGRAKVKQEIYGKLKELADAGNVAALKFLAVQLEGGNVPTADVGKKAAAREAAKNPEAGTPLGDLMRRRQANVQDLVTPPPDGWVRMESSH